MFGTWQQAYGPFLRFQDYAPISSDQALWLGSVLYVCHSSVSALGELGLTVIDQGVQLHVRGFILDTCLDLNFWRFDLRFELNREARNIAYWVELPGSVRQSIFVNQWQFTIPGAVQKWRWTAYSCSGYSSSVDRTKWGGDDHPMFQDMLREHARDPFHALVGGGDQLYNDKIFHVSVELVNWVQIKNRRARLAIPFSAKMLAEAEEFYLKNYCTCFSEKGMKDAFASIPSVMIWDDHDIFDGWGSYPDDLLFSSVFQGIYQVACRFYLLFQQHTTYRRAMENESGLFGGLGPCNHASFNFMKQFGLDVSILGVDIRAERTKKQILSAETWEMVFGRICSLPPTVRHVIILFTVPILYPKVPLTEATLEMLSSLNHIDAVNTLINKTGLLSSIMAFDEPELLDDLLDHWTAGTHTIERNMVVNRLQEIAREKGLRVTFLSGDVHCAALGQFYTYPKMRDLSKDPRYMPQIISSAIVNAPPPNVLIKMMHVFNTAKQSVNKNTREKMVRVFKGRYKQSDKVMGRRNYLIVQGDSNDSLQCTLRIELVEALGSVETFKISVPALSGFEHLRAELARTQTFPSTMYHVSDMSPSLGTSPYLPPGGRWNRSMALDTFGGQSVSAFPMLQQPYSVPNPYIAPGQPGQSGMIGGSPEPNATHPPELNQQTPPSHRSSHSTDGFFGPVI